jgi:hypothetical protein
MIKRNSIGSSPVWATSQSILILCDVFSPRLRKGSDFGSVSEAGL